ncbi:RNA recognition motif domain-containing protein [Planktothrix pseudagardhii]|uniref:28 kDa ribonucleoprotein, chloroplastic n=2 Tax=Planktothrix TaxID=54304 RepID=A0A9W4CRN7_9CYAN|nr:RNA-binding protein [Planktothrix pseudagardhii]CAD5979181.1 28 kDa ribonucleoprotein, chloroplastic [Planktothrix pseudagardhii]
MSVRLYVGNLPKELERKELQEVFVEEGDTVSAKVITDRKTGKCRGFGFVTVQTDEIADQIVEKYNGVMFRENALKIEKALPRKKGKGEGVGGSENGGEEQPQQQQQAPVQQPVKAGNTPKSGGSSGGGGGGKNRNKKSKHSSGGYNSTPKTGGDEGFQPDPRWANELEKLKQMLAAQAANP